MAGSTSTTLNDLLPAITAEAMFVANERSIMRGLVKCACCASLSIWSRRLPSKLCELAARWDGPSSPAGGARLRVMMHTLRTHSLLSGRSVRVC